MITTGFLFSVRENKQIMWLHIFRTWFYLKGLSCQTCRIFSFFLSLSFIAFFNQNIVLAEPNLNGAETKSSEASGVLGYELYIDNVRASSETYKSSWGKKIDSGLLQNMHRQYNEFFWVNYNNRSCLFTDQETVRHARDIVSPSSHLWEAYGKAEGNYWRQHTAHTGTHICENSSQSCQSVGVMRSTEEPAVEAVRQTKKDAQTQANKERIQLRDLAEKALQNNLGKCE